MILDDNIDVDFGVDRQNSGQEILDKQYKNGVGVTYKHS
jgi:hypothetical protein